MTKEEAIKKIKCWLTDYFPMDDADEIDEIIEAISQPHLVGHWIQEWNVDHFEQVCSECGYGEHFKSNYCPNCGADMQTKIKKDKDIEITPTTLDEDIEITSITLEKLNLDPISVCRNLKNK